MRITNNEYDPMGIYMDYYEGGVMLTQDDYVVIIDRKSVDAVRKAINSGGGFIFLGKYTVDIKSDEIVISNDYSNIFIDDVEDFLLAWDGLFNDELTHIENEYYAYLQGMIDYKKNFEDKMKSLYRVVITK